MDNKIVDACEQLYQRAMKEGVRTTSSDGDRESDGSYVRGWQKYFTYATLQQDDNVIKATHADWKTFNLNSDREGTSFRIEVSKGTEVVFAAEREGFLRTNNFSGSDERFAGRSVTPETAWKVVQGTFPEQLLIAPPA